jgi:hypothetical protein
MSGFESRSRQSATRRLSPPESCRRAAQGVHGDFDGAVELPGIGCIDRILELALLLEQVVHLVVGHLLAELRAQLVELLQQGAGLGDALLDVAEYVLRGIELGLLGEMANPDFADGLGLSHEVTVETGHDSE